MPPYAPPDSPSGSARLEFRVTLLVLALAVALASMPETWQDSLAGAMRGTALRPFLAMQEGLVNARVRSETAEVLQGRIDSLTAITVGRTTLAEENRRLRGLLGLRTRLGSAWRPVQVVRPGTPDSESMLIIDAGSEEGVRPQAPLITREGLAGKIRESYSDRAVGMDWSHPDFAASAMTVDGLQYGLVESRAGIFREDARLVLRGLPYHAVIDSGTVVVTSGLGGAFPRGIPIGRVTSEADPEADAVGRWRKSYWLEPFVEVGSVSLALVGLPGVTTDDDLSSAWEEGGYLTASERMAREEALADSLKALRDSIARSRIPGVTGEGR